MKVAFFVFLIALPAWAAKFKGFEKSAGVTELSFKEAIVEFDDEDEDFLIGFAQHAAFYRFPKNKENKAEITRFLRERIKSKHEVTVKVDPKTTEILEIQD